MDSVEHVDWRWEYLERANEKVVLVFNDMKTHFNIAGHLFVGRSEWTSVCTCGRRQAKPLALSVCLSLSVNQCVSLYEQSSDRAIVRSSVLAIERSCERAIKRPADRAI